MLARGRPPRGYSEPADGELSAGDSWALMPGIRLPVPRHQGHVTSCGVPPRPEISRPVPRQAMQLPPGVSVPESLSVSSGVAHGVSPYRAESRSYSRPTAARITAVEAARPVKISNEERPLADQELEPIHRRHATRPARREPARCLRGVDQVDHAAEAGQGILGQRQPGQRGAAVEADRGAVDQHVRRRRQRSPVCRRAPGSAPSARSAVRFQIRTSPAPASNSAHTAARALPPAPSTSAVRPAIGKGSAACTPVRRCCRPRAPRRVRSAACWRRRSPGARLCRGARQGECRRLVGDRDVPPRESRRPGRAAITSPSSGGATGSS